MPFKSKAQQRFMFAKHPETARRWADHTPDIKGLPEKVDSADKEKKAYVTASQLGHFSVQLEKSALLDPAVANALGVGVTGAGIGGISGLVGGLIDPGHEDVPDEQGFLRRRRRNRLVDGVSRGLSGALTGGLLGAAVGGIGTELARPIVSAKLRADVDAANQHGSGLANNQTKTWTGWLDNKGNQLGNLAESTALRAKSLAFDNMSRAQQHASMHDSLPFLYLNPFSAIGNVLAGYGKEFESRYPPAELQRLYGNR